MRIRAHLRDLRGRTPLRAAEAETGVNRGYLSMLEQGRLLPRDEWIPGLEKVYGPKAGWYPPEVLLVFEYPEVDPDA